ncbi:MAG: hypothetical protein JSS86_21545 [Cyanobacteria bacterium SZAS LIN-2]|nr:hypothetical protein [Cyanobacteria bacterium SZAS LIN-3]MBS1998931.1 hypothetical protein [Cyanobacteria bacterium SZAS LIN-2]MBS2006775.1 hypothetical protein [Cyanobacteria bacterium SZAS TMP-1]
MTSRNTDLNTDVAVKAVRGKYDEIMMLLERYNACDCKTERETIISEVSACLNHLSLVEDKDIYPVIREQSHSGGLEGCEETHSQVRLVLDKLMRLCADIDKSDYEQQVQKLRSVVKELKSMDEDLFVANEL